MKKFEAETSASRLRRMIAMTNEMGYSILEMKEINDKKEYID